MTRARKIWIVVAALLLVTVSGWLLVVGAAYAMGGVMSVHLLDRESGREVFLPVPMALLELVVGSATSPAVYAAGLGEVQVDGLNLDLGAAGSVLLGILEELDDLPDATLVEVVDRRSSVRIAKSGDRLVVEIDDPGTSLSFSVPTRGVARLADRLLN